MTAHHFDGMEISEVGSAKSHIEEINSNEQLFLGLNGTMPPQQQLQIQQQIDYSHRQEKKDSLPA